MADKEVKKIEQKKKPATKFKRNVKTVARTLHKLKIEKIDFSAMRKAEVWRSKLTEKLIEEICIEIIKGHYPQVACKMCGVSYTTVEDWLYIGKADRDRIEALANTGVKIAAKDITIHHQLYSSIQKALHMAEDRDLAAIDFAAQMGVWQAAAWKMERRYNERWGKLLKVDQNVTGQVNVNAQHVIMTPDQAGSIDEWKAQRAGRNEQQTIDQYQPGTQGQIAKTPAVPGGRNFDNVME